LVIGDYGLSYDQQRFQMAMWSMMSAPLFVSADLRTTSYDSMKILLNDIAIGIDQDRGGELGVEFQTVCIDYSKFF
jgi:Alpha galactosidase A